MASANTMVTTALVRRILDFDADAIPPEVMEHTKLFILDTLGCALGGYATETGKRIADQAGQFQGSESATVIGDGAPVAMPMACWANASMANLLDMDDVFAGTAHQACCLVATALAVAEAGGNTGRDLVAAVVLGFEVGSRIMMYAWPSPEKTHLYFPATWQVCNAAVVAAYLRGLDEKAIRHSLGLAGMVPPIPINMQKFVERPMGFAKNPFGWTTLTGVFWTLMAERGVTGAANVMDGEAGFATMIGSDGNYQEELFRDWGQRYNIMETKYKPYPFCTWGHTSLDAFRELLTSESIEPASIRRIDVSTVSRAASFLSDKKLNSMYDAQFSLPHAISMLAMGKNPGPEWTTRWNMHENPQAAQIADCVHLEPDSLADRRFEEEKGAAIPATVTVTTRSGHRYKCRKVYSKGSQNDPFTADDLRDKFRTITASVLSDARSETLRRKVEVLDCLQDVSQLTKLLAQDGDNT